MTDPVTLLMDKFGPALSNLRGERVFITGATGFFGKWLIPALVGANKKLALKAEFHCLVRDPDAAYGQLGLTKIPPELKLVKGDVVDFAFPSGGYSHVIHMATPASARMIREEPLKMMDVIVRGAKRVAEFCDQCRARSVLFTSSGAVYGPQPAGLSHIPEEYMGAPGPHDWQAPYGEAKRMAETWLAAAAKRSGFELKIARGFAFGGEHLPLDAHYALGNFVRDAVAGPRIRIESDGTPRRSYLYGGDLAVWLTAILLKGRKNGIYNVGSPDSRSMSEIARVVAGEAARAEGRHVTVDVAKVPVAGTPIEAYVPDVTLARSELGLEAWTPLETIVSRMYAWAAQRPAQEGARP